jgi:predicted nucleic acid-binding protein
VRVAFDTSVLVAALAPALPAHASAYAWVRAALGRRIEGFMSWHAFAETWAVLTRLPITPAPTPATARDSLASLRKFVRCRPLDASAYEAAVMRCVERGLRSGAIFDALHVVCAERGKADVLVTADVADFQRLADGDALRIVSHDVPPESITSKTRR